MKIGRLYLQRDLDDESLLHICSQSPSGEMITWATVDADILSYIDPERVPEWTSACIEECERELILKG